MWKLGERRSYYLMSASGAGIGYALATIDQNISISQSQMLLVSILFWSISFAYGLRRLHFLSELMRISVLNLTELPQFQREPSLFAEMQKISKNAGDENSSSEKLKARFQNAFLLLGALAFIPTKIDLVAVVIQPTSLLFS